jgi:hypothetical protein
MRQLDRLGWELSEDDDGGPLTVGTTADGREVLALYGRDAIISAPSLAEIGASFAALQAAAGVLPTQRDGRAHDTV